MDLFKKFVSTTYQYAFTMEDGQVAGWLNKQTSLHRKIDPYATHNV